MVYVTEGAFEVGDGGSLPGTFEAGDSGSPFTISSEDGLILGGTSITNLSNHDYGDDDFNYADSQILQPSYPKGFDAFYLMKYEISQGQYAAFLSALPTTEADIRFANQYGEDGYTIQLIAVPNLYQADLPDRAANYLNWVDLAWYADWSGLRPMSELEYEKACRGADSSVLGEYAWGNALIRLLSYTIEDIGTTAERISDPTAGAGNAMHYGSTLDFRVIFKCGAAAAAFENPSRQEAGAGYFGAMDLTGNAIERIVNISSVEGRLFDGDNHGDGDPSGTTVDTWPSIDEAVPENVGKGTGSRGGSWTIGLTNGPVSSRIVSNYDDPIRSSTGGGRLVRSDF